MSSGGAGFNPNVKLDDGGKWGDFYSKNRAIVDKQIKLTDEEVHSAQITIVESVQHQEIKGFLQMLGIDKRVEPDESEGD